MKIKSIRLPQPGIPAIVAFMVLVFVACKTTPVETVEIRGIYGNPKPFWSQGLNLPDLGVNAVFVHSGSINQAMVARARSEGVKVFAEFATLNGRNYVEEHPEAWAINEKGIKVEAATWFMGVCPTEPGFRKYRNNQLRVLLQQFDLDGVWLDYVHWHAQFEDPEPILPETCFCDHCIKGFSDDLQLVIPEGPTDERAEWILENEQEKWRDWRCKVVYEWTVEMKGILQEERPGALLGLYHCPWNDEEFDGARRRILGLDYGLLKQSIDVFSPMVYHGRMERPPEWVETNIRWFSDKLTITENDKTKIWPIVQAHNDPYVIDSEEFELVLRGGMSAASSGVMMFTSYSVAEDSAKMEVMRNVYKPSGH
jgi:hypothetical protein